VIEEPSQTTIGLLSIVEAFAEAGVPLRTTVRGTSMTPFIRDGDVVVVDPIRGAPPCVGDVVAFRHPGTRRLTVHRIVGRDPAGWVLRGDGCPAADGVVPEADILGRVVTVERRGKPVRLGLGASGAWVAALSRGGWLRRLLVAAGLPRRGAGFALRAIRRRGGG